LDELRQRLRLEAGDIITEDWYSDLVEYLSLITKESAVDYDGYIHKSLIPKSDAEFSLGTADYRLNEVYAVNGNFDNINSKTGAFSDSLTVQGKTVLKDEDPIHIASFFDYAKEQVKEAVLDAINAWLQSPLQTYDNCLVVTSRLEDKIERGIAFSVSKRFNSISSGESVKIVFINPSQSNKKAHIVIVEIISTGQGAIDVYKDVTIEQSGIQLGAMNLNFGSANTATCIVETGGTYTAGSLVYEGVVHGGIRVNAVGSIITLGKSIIVSEGKNFMLQFTNRAQTAVDVSIKIIWWEE